MADKSERRDPTTTYADPLQAFRAEMDKLAETFFGRGMMPTWPYRTWRAGWGVPVELVVMPVVDLKEDDTAVVLSVALPVMTDADVELSVKNGVLTIKGEKKQADEHETDDVKIMEPRYVQMQRSLRLPESVDPENISAAFADGVLTVTMLKKPEAAPAANKISAHSMRDGSSASGAAVRTSDVEFEWAEDTDYYAFIAAWLALRLEAKHRADSLDSTLKYVTAQCERVRAATSNGDEV